MGMNEWCHSMAVTSDRCRFVIRSSQVCGHGHRLEVE